MGFLSNNVSMTRYRVLGQIDGPLIDILTRFLTQNAIVEIDDEDMNQSIGWTSFEDPFAPDFSGSSFIFGSYFVFSLRIDKKFIPPKIVNKKYLLEIKKRLKESNKDFLSRNEKKHIKEEILHRLSVCIPATPNVFDVFWDYEKSTIWFFSTQKSANEHFEIFFTKTFKLHLIRYFPYTTAMEFLSDNEIDSLNKLLPSRFME